MLGHFRGLGFRDLGSGGFGPISSDCRCWRPTWGVCYGDASDYDPYHWDPLKGTPNGEKGDPNSGLFDFFGDFWAILLHTFVGAVGLSSPRWFPMHWIHDPHAASQNEPLSTMKQLNAEPAARNSNSMQDLWSHTLVAFRGYVLKLATSHQKT